MPGFQTASANQKAQKQPKKKSLWGERSFVFIIFPMCLSQFILANLATRRDGQLRICHRLCNVPHWFWRASQVTFCHLACTPVPRYECASRHFSMWRPSETHTCHIPTPPACTPVPRYGRTSQVTFCHLACTLASLMQLVKGSKFQFDLRILTWWPRLTQGYGWCVRCCSPKATGRSTKDGEIREDRCGLDPLLVEAMSEGFP